MTRQALQPHLSLPVSNARSDPDSRAASYRVNEWLEEFKVHRSGIHKQIGYAALWPILHVEARRWLSEATLRSYSPVGVFRDRGFPIESRRRWALSGLDVSNSVILVQGTGSGWDVLTWARHRPKRIIATDLFAFDAWGEVSRYAAAKWSVECEFHQAPLEDHRFLADGSIDACVSDNVFEHCRNLDAVLTETRRVLKPGGRLYAAYGPLWFSPGGDHYSGRGGLHTVYNHLLLPPFEYKRTSRANNRMSRIFRTATVISNWISSRE